MIDIRSDAEISDILERCYLDTKLFCQVFFPDYFSKPFSKKIHDPIFECIDNPANKLIAITAPRGIGKSSILNMALPAKHILYQDKKFIIPISQSADAAVEMGENLKEELLANKLIYEFFGKMDSWKWSEKQWITSSGIKILPRGAGQQVRGRRFGKDRPDLIIVDDLEDDKEVQNEELRKFVRDWFFNSLLNSVDRGSSNWQVIVIGTIRHEDSLLIHLQKDPEFVHLDLEICDEELNSNWPEFIPTEQIHHMHDVAKERGELAGFYREYRGITMPPGLAGFRPEFFVNYTESEDELNRNPDIESIVMADPAKTHTDTSCNSAVVGVSIDTKTMRIYVRDVVERQMFPDELYDEMIDMAVRIRARVLGPEVTSLNEYITYPLRNRMMQRRKFFDIVEVKPRDKKATRAASLIPLYRTGMVKHNPACCARLESSLMAFPHPQSWDVIDCLSNLTFVLEFGERYFIGVHDDTPEEIEKEYDELKEDNEPPLSGWRRV